MLPIIREIKLRKLTFMRYMAILLAGIMMVGCSKDEGQTSSIHDTQPKQNKKTTQNEKSIKGDLDEPVKVTYQVKADGSIGNGKFHIDGESKSFCGGEKFEFSFQTKEKQKLVLEALSRKNAVNKLQLKLLINGKVVKEGSGEEKDLFHKGSIAYQLNDSKGFSK